MRAELEIVENIFSDIRDIELTAQPTSAIRVSAANAQEVVLLLISNRQNEITHNEEYHNKLQSELEKTKSELTRLQNNITEINKSSQIYLPLE
jgi:peptidoglycan hydrolase CwlO-like protein